jgi:membrane-associated phospholipid phosphatase
LLATLCEPVGTETPIGAALLALVVGASRVYLEAHWLTDVLGGYALEAVWVALLVATKFLAGSRMPPGTGGSTTEYETRMIPVQGGCNGRR